jgi:hypothetical protein
VFEKKTYAFVAFTPGIKAEWLKEMKEAKKQFHILQIEGKN